MTFEGVLAIVLIIGAILLFHESGHFLSAKLCRMRVDEFGMGLPLKAPIVAFKRGQTSYSLNWIPFGAFVRIAGMDPEEQQVENGFHTRPLWQRALVLSAGSAMNVVLATLLFLLAGVFFGELVGSSTTIRTVIPGRPADRAGLKRGDRIVSVNDRWTSTSVADVRRGSAAAQAGLRPDDRITEVADREVYDFQAMVRRLGKTSTGRIPVTVLRRDQDEQRLTEHRFFLSPLRDASAILSAAPHSSVPVSVDQLGVTFEPLRWENVAAIIHNAPRGRTLSVTVVRDGTQITKRMVPEMHVERLPDRDTGELEMEQIGLIGVAPAQVYRKLPPLRAIWSGVEMTLFTVQAVVEELTRVILGESRPEVISIVKIAVVIQDSTHLGWYLVLQLGGLISFAIGFLNILPLPPFDGWRLVYIGYEGVIGRTPDRKKEALINFVGFVVIMCAFVVLVLKDVAELVANRAVR